MNTKNAAASKKRGRRYELTDDGWERIESLLPKQARGGRWADHRTVLNGMFWVLNNGAPWRDMPERYGRWETVYGRFRRWTDEGLIDRILKRLHVSLDADGRIDWSGFDVDGSSIRAHVSAAGGAESSRKSVESLFPLGGMQVTLCRFWDFGAQQLCGDSGPMAIRLARRFSHGRL